MFDRYEIIGGVFNPNYPDNLAFAQKLGLDKSRIYIDFETMIQKESELDPEVRMEVVSVLTPNFLHYPMAKKLLENNFHVICEKPLTTTYKEALDLKKIDYFYSFTTNWTYTADRDYILTEINTNITLPNGEPAPIEPNSSIIYKITKPKAMPPLPKPLEASKGKKDDENKKRNEQESR